MPTLLKDLRVGANVTPPIRDSIISVIKDHWDCFAKEGTCRPILGYEFAIDTGASTPVCCKKPAYGPHESKIIMEQIETLLQNKWIRRCRGAWGSLIVLAAKPHQEHVENIDDFIWRMCVSYRGVNAVTKPFQFPIPRCDDSIISLEQGPSTIYQISMDADAGYHQVKVRPEDQDKLAFFAPDHHKYTFTVMPFGPCNAPTFYTAMMLNFKEEWDTLFVVQVRDMKFVDGKPVVVNGTLILIGPDKLYYGSRSIIDDILIWTSVLSLTIVYFRCVCMVFQKYRVSFKLKKCEFLKTRTEYVGYDVLSSGNSPAESKFDMINDWPTPTTGQSLHSFIGLVNFYHRFAPYLEIRLKPLRQLCKKYYRKQIPTMEWTPQLLQLFGDLKVSITSGPVLARYNPDKPTFLKTDWSAEGMGWILMQPADDEESQRASKELLDSGKCLFDLCKNGARLRPIAFGSRACTDMEKKLHSFLGEIACGRWAIGQNRRLLWGSFFYWMCDCSAVKEVLHYEGSISYVCRWSQELLGYHFACIHRSNKMMADVDSLTRRYGKGIATHLAVAYMLHSHDSATRPAAYDPDAFCDDLIKKLAPNDSPHHIITESVIQHVELYNDPDLNSSPPSHVSLFTSPLHFRTNPLPSNSVVSTDQSMRSLEHTSQLHATALVIDDTLSLCSSWFTHFSAATHFWTINRVFTADTLLQFSRLMSQSQPDPPHNILVSPSLHDLPISLPTVTYIDWTCAAWDGIGIDWLHHVCSILQPILHQPSKLVLCNLWIPTHYCQRLSIASAQAVVAPLLPSHWRCHCSSEHATRWGESIDLYKFLIVISKIPNPHIHRSEFQPTDAHNIFDKLTSLNHPCHVPIPDITVPHDAMLSLHDCDIFQSRTVGITGSDIKSLSTSSMILDPLYPAREPSASHCATTHFHRRFGIALPSDDHAPTPVIVPSNEDMLTLYSAPSLPPTVNQFCTNTLDSTLRVSTPCNMKTLLIHSILASSGLTDNIYYGGEETMEATRCYFTKSPPHLINWTDHYAQDPSTAAMISGLRHGYKEKVWSPTELSLIHKSYHSHLQHGEIHLLGDKLMLYKPIFQNVRYIGLIIVPTSLRRTLFSHYHCGPTGGHMGEYKTLFRMRLRFFWPGMRTDIKAWVKGCPQCIESNIWRTRRQELYFSWPVTAPFYIMHIDLWQPGKLTDHDQKSIYLFNCMCDLTQFVVSSVVKNPNSVELARIFMSEVILSFGMCSVVVVDADSKFRSVFEETCHKLRIMIWPLARGNHKGLSVERYHRFLNKTQTIIGHERGSHLTILQNCKLSQYAWNSAPIDNTDVTRSMAAVGREFRFPLDVDLSPTPILNDSTNSSLYEYLRSMSNTGPFATSMIQVLVDERRQAHQDRLNHNASPHPFKVGDAVTARIVVNSRAQDGVVKKLSYQAKGPFQITAALGSDSFEVQRYGDDSSERRKYKGSDLFLLPPAIFPNDPLDTTDNRYLNFDYVPLVDSLQSALNIDLHNDTYFSMEGKKFIFEQRPHSTPVNDKAFSWHDAIPSISQLHAETKTSNTVITEERATNTGHDSLLSSITNSNDKVFFIKYLPEGMMRPKWYLIQVDMESTKEVNPEYVSNHQYWCVFCAKHTDDTYKSDEYARWWPDWYKYTKNEKTGKITYGQRVLIRPSVTPSSTTHIQWADLIELNSDTILLGPFNFQSVTNTNRARNTVHQSFWQQLRKICNDNNLLPPTLGAHSSHKINTRNLARKHQPKRKRTPSETQSKSKKSTR